MVFLKLEDLPEKVTLVFPRGVQKEVSVANPQGNFRSSKNTTAGKRIASSELAYKLICNILSKFALTV